MLEKRKQDERLQVRCTSDEKKLLQEAADKANRSLSNFVLNAALNEARKVRKERD